MDATMEEGDSKDDGVELRKHGGGWRRLAVVGVTRGYWW